MTILAPVAFVDKMGEAIIDAPRKADLAGQYAGRATLRTDPLAAADDTAKAIGLFSEAVLGLAEPSAMRPSATSRGAPATTKAAEATDDAAEATFAEAGVARLRST